MSNEFRKKVLESLYAEGDGTAVDTAPNAIYSFSVKLKGKINDEPLDQEFVVNVRAATAEQAKAQAFATAQKQGYKMLDVVGLDVVPDSQWHEKNTLETPNTQGVPQDGTGYGFQPEVLNGMVGLDKVSKVAAETPKTGANANEPGYRAAIQGHE